MYELNRHKKSDAIKWGVVTVVILLIIATIVVGVGSSWFTNWDTSTWFGREPKQEQTGADKKKDKGGAVVGDITENGLALAGAIIARANYADYGVSASAETAYTLTASVNPPEADNKEVDWTVEFIDASSSWAKGKIVTDYVTITPTADGASTAVIECKAAFAEKILVKVSLRTDVTLNATCSVDYKQRYIETYSVANYSDASHPGIGAICNDNKSVTMDCPHDISMGFHNFNSVKVPTVYKSQVSSVYTIALKNEITFKYYVKLSTDFVAALSSLTEMKDAKLATDWVLVDETSSDISTATSEAGASSANSYTIHSFMGNLCDEVLTLNGGPDCYRFDSVGLPAFIRAAKTINSYHFQVKVVAELGAESNETVHNVTFLESSLLIPVSSVAINSSGIIF